VTKATAKDEVSVVIPARNGVRFLREAIASVHAQTHAATEIVVVDNGSTDATAELAVDCGARCVGGRGWSAAEARNRGVRASACAFIAFLDHDDLWLPHKLERQIAHLRGHPHLGFVSGRVRVRVEPGAGPSPGLRNASPGDVIPGALGSTLMVRSDAFAAVGSFDLELSTSEDFDWLLRARDAGVQGEELHEVLAEYRIHGPSLSSDRATADAELFDILRASIRRRGRPLAADGGPDAS
jgi:glycosyltransferase involved in cell wall biosynthesis